MAEGKPDINEDELDALIEGLEDLDIDLTGTDALEEAANVSDDELDALLEKHEFEDSIKLKSLNDSGLFSDPKMDDDDDWDSVPEYDPFQGAKDDDPPAPEELDDMDFSDGMGAEEELSLSNIDTMDMDALSALLGDDLSSPGAGETYEADEPAVFEEPAESDISELSEESANPDEFDEFDYLFGNDGEQVHEEAEDNEALEETPWQDDLFGDVLSAAVEDGPPEDEMIMPDFGFNESFTTGEKDGDLIASARAVREAREKSNTAEDDFYTESENTEAEKTSFFKLISEKVRSIIPDPAREKIASVNAKINNVKKKRISQRTKFIVTAVIMLIALLISSAFLYRQYSAMKVLIEENKVIVRDSGQGLNYANFIYTENKKTLNGAELTLKRLLLDNYMCMFSFSSHINMDKCFAELRDNNGNYYGKYLPLSDSRSRAWADIESTSLWFEGVKEGAEALYLTIWDSSTKEAAEFEIDIKDYKPPDIKYMDAAKGARSEYSDLTVVIEDGTFSSAMSSLIYRLENKGEATIVHGVTASDVTTSLENSGRSILPLLKTPLIYEDGDIMIGRMDFNPARSLENNVRLTLENLYQRFEINQLINAAPLFEYTENDEMRIDFGGGAIIFEGMRGADGIYVLVYHLEDKTGERVNGVVDAGMLVKTYTGLEVKLEPHTRSKIEGGDMLFEYQTPNTVLESSRLENVYIDLRSVMLKIPDVTTDILLQEFTTDSREQNYEDVKAFVKNAYMQRLAVKSGAGDKSALNNYFDSAVLNDPHINKLYERQAVTAAPEYAVIVSTVAKLSRFEYLAIVDESWLGISGDERTHIYNSHQITVKQNGNNFVIMNDKLLEKVE